MASDYAKLQNIDDKTIKDVLSVDGTTLKGTSGNELFGLTLDGTVDDIIFVDKDGISTLPSSAPTGTYKISFYTKDGVKDDSVNLSSIVSTDSKETKGKDLNVNGIVVYTFENEEKAKEVAETYLPQASVVENKVLNKFASSVNSKSLKELEGLLNGTAVASASPTPTTPTAPATQMEVRLHFDNAGPNYPANEGDTNVIGVSYNAYDTFGNYLNTTLTDDLTVVVEAIPATNGSNSIDANDLSGPTIFSLTIPAGQTSSYDWGTGMWGAMIEINDDSDQEDIEYFLLNVVSATLGANDLAVGSTVVTHQEHFGISANDGSTTPVVGTVTVQSTNPSGVDEGSNIEFYAEYQNNDWGSQRLTQDVSIEFRLEAPDSGNALDSSDVPSFGNTYTAVISAGQNDSYSSLVSVATTDDATMEDIEKAKIVITNITLDPADVALGSSLTASSSVREASIKYNDGFVPTLSLSMMAPSSIASEDEGTTQYIDFQYQDTTWNGQTLTQDATVTYRIVPTGTDPISAGDISLAINTPLQVTIMAGSESASVAVDYISDGITESLESYQVVIDSVTLGANDSAAGSTMDISNNTSSTLNIRASS